MTKIPGFPSYGVDDGVPHHGRRYGGADTIHNTGTVDVVLKDGVVTEVWFRCQPLAFQVRESESGKYTARYGSNAGARLVAVEVAE